MKCEDCIHSQVCGYKEADYVNEETTYLTYSKRPCPHYTEKVELENLTPGMIYKDKSNGHELEFLYIKNNAYWFKDLTSSIAFMVYHKREYDKYIKT